MEARAGKAREIVSYAVGGTRTSDNLQSGKNENGAETRWQGEEW